MIQQDLVSKKAAITKLGTPVLAWGRTRGVVLGEEAGLEGTNNFRVSLSDSGVNWVDIISIEHIEVDDGVYKKASTKNEYIEIEDAGCEGGACKI